MDFKEKQFYLCILILQKDRHLSDLKRRLNLKSHSHTAYIIENSYFKSHIKTRICGKKKFYYFKDKKRVEELTRFEIEDYFTRKKYFLDYILSLL